MKIAICEDKAEDSAHLVRLLNTWMTEQQMRAEIRCFESGESLLAQWEPGYYQIVFMDIYLTGRNGIKTAQKIRQHDAGCVIILTTSSTEHGMEGFAVGALHYLIKPVRYEAMNEALRRCRNVLEAHARYIEVSENRVPVRILLRNIQYVEVMGNNCLIHTTTGVVKVYTTLDQLGAQLDGPTFLRCHRSYVVNLQKVSRLQDKDFMLEGGEVVPVGRAYRADARQAYDTYLAAALQS